jgi:hypothetical protein
MLAEVKKWAGGGGKDGKGAEVGSMLNRSMLSALPFGSLLVRFEKMWQKVKQWTSGKEVGKGVGKDLMLNVIAGLLGIDLKGPLGKKFSNAAKNAADESQSSFKAAGKNAAAGYIQGFKDGGLAGGVWGSVKNAWDEVRKKQREGSPAKIWIPRGRNAALGFVKGFRDAKLGKHLARELRDGMVNLGDVPKSVWNKLLEKGWKGRAGDDAERLYRPMRTTRMDRERFGVSGRGDAARERARRNAERELAQAQLRHLAQMADNAARAGDEAGARRLRELFSQRREAAWMRESGGRQARLPKHRTSAGLAWDKANRGANKEELREVMHEISDRQVAGFAKALRENIRGGMSTGQLDAALGGYIQHRNNMRPDVR